ncbi:NAD(P)-dependent oxidoreductase [Falsibacillus albus]|uniref:SDR family oxidoreductase n=1 Tax=Falsibacillus albus TaxID=2478915 RepID=A0A3L7JSW7_9BACI|nr:SDR family oxidoreductase [Falsibacillus albus]RLQ93365.1 SDR family oxidoreductase [Falsibacillus albus]
MNIIVFGASGGTGEHVVQQTLEEGHSVTAFVRNPEKLTISYEQLKIIKGDALKFDDAAKAIEGHDVVISCLGAHGLGKTTELSQMTSNIIEGMKQHNVNRILYMASAGIYKEIPGITGWLAQKILKNVLEDHRRAVDQLAQSDFEWTAARPMGLTKKELTAHYRTKAEGIPEGGRNISRADVAHFFTRELQNRQFIRQSVGLAY